MLSTNIAGTNILTDYRVDTIDIFRNRLFFEKLLTLSVETINLDVINNKQYLSYLYTAYFPTFLNVNAFNEDTFNSIKNTSLFIDIDTFILEKFTKYILLKNTFRFIKDNFFETFPLLNVRNVIDRLKDIKNICDKKLSILNTYNRSLKDEWLDETYLVYFINSFITSIGKKKLKQTILTDQHIKEYTIKMLMYMSKLCELLIKNLNSNQLYEDKYFTYIINLFRALIIILKIFNPQKFKVGGIGLRFEKINEYKNTASILNMDNLLFLISAYNLDWISYLISKVGFDS